MADLYSGYWGPVDSIADWCESNYNITFYIAEFYNTLSSIPMVIFAVVGMIATYYSPVNERRFMFTFMNLAFVGFGSTFFHATLRYYAQVLDQTPMLIGSLSCLYCILMTDSIPGQSYPKTTIFFILWGVFSMCLNVVLKIHILFILNYGALTLSIMIFSYTKCSALSRKSLAGKLFKWSLLIYLFGITLWFLEKKYCNTVQLYNFHAIWHLFAGYGSYLAICCAMVCRATYLKRYTKLQMIKLCAVPLVHYTSISDKYQN